MNLQGSGSNHNRKPKLNDDDSIFMNFQDGDEYERITGQKPSVSNTACFDSEEERAAKLKEAKEKENSRAYDELDDFVYRQVRRRHYSKKHRHRHRSHSSHSSEHGTLVKKKKRKRHRRKRFKRWQKVCIIIISSILALIIASIVTLIILIIMGKSAMLDNSGLNINVPDNAVTGDNGNTIIYKGEKYRYNENITSILCMGIDKDEFSDVDGEIGTGGNADSIFVITLDLHDGTTKLINISRDTMTDIGIYSPSGKYVGQKNAQIALAYAYGDGRDTSCHNELVSVRELLYNVPINSYLSLDMNGIVAINDAIGGVTVVSPETIGDFKQGKSYTLMGDLAQSFVRKRSHATVEGNSLRMQRQKVYLEGFASSLVSKTKYDLTAPITIFNTASPYVCTNIDASKVAFLSINAIQGNYKAFEIENVPGKVKQGEKYAEFYVDENKFFEMFLDIYYIKIGKA